MSDKINPSIEQAERATEDVAKMGAAYFKALMESGFDRNEAYDLARDYLNLYLETLFIKIGRDYTE